VAITKAVPKYNLRVVELNSDAVVYEEELIIKRYDGGVFIDNLANTMLVSMEDAIEEAENA